jgi:RNA polymerase sigma-70 factor (ECF subfamily)
MGSSRSTSHSLLAGIRGGDDQAWRRLVELYSPFVLHWCRRDGVREEDLADVYQEVFQAVASKIELFRKERPGHTFRGWLRTITRHKSYDLYRRSGQEPRGAGGSELQRRIQDLPAVSEPTPEPEEVLGPDREQERRLFWDSLEQIRSCFKESTWRAFWRTAVDGQPPHEVAEELGMSAGAVRVAKSRVLHRLRQDLGDLV